MGKISTLIVSLLLFGCTPKVDSVSYQDAFKKWNWDKKINEVDSTASMSIEFNTYKGFFEVRESAFSFKKNLYYIDFNPHCRLGRQF
jgi:hypothetical protein